MIKLFRYTFKYKNGVVAQTKWISIDWEAYKTYGGDVAKTVELLMTEEKEVPG
jgi:hypothetical protein